MPKSQTKWRWSVEFELQVLSKMDEAVRAMLAGELGIDAVLLRFVAAEVDEAVPAMQSQVGSLAAAIAELETRMSREALGAASGNQSEAAWVLGVSRVGLIKKLSRLGIK